VSRPFIAFHFGLVQDVAILRPVVRLAAQRSTADCILLVSEKFAGRDVDDRWRFEIDRLGAEIGVTPFVYAAPSDFLIHVGARRGMIIAGSESDVAAHADAHDLFRSMPGRIRTVTLQHGLECVGFLHNARHDATAGRNVRFAADIAVSWFALDRLPSVTPAERSKLFLAGPSTMIEQGARQKDAKAGLPGMICENLHSVRFVNGRMRQGFLDAFTDFAERLDMIGQSLVLRAHPAGRFTERSGLALPRNVTVSQEPLYDLDLSDFAYVISAPSTILFDFVLAGIPAAVWVDPDKVVDASSFDGLSEVASVDDWWRFHWAAQWERENIVERQDRYRDRLGLPKNIRKRYESLLALA
jgi:hypothetical protein